MKGLIIGFLGFAIILLGGWEWLKAKPTTPVELHTQQAAIVEQVTTIGELSGVWHAFPNGLLLQFEEDGSALFGLDTQGNVLGYEAVILFESQILSIQFTDYEGRHEACLGQAGLYSVQSHPDGSISFALIKDNCQFRRESLSGRLETDVSPRFYLLLD